MSPVGSYMIRTLVISAVQCTLTTMGIFREQGEAQRLGENSFQIFIYSNRPQIFGTRHLKKYSLLWLSHVSLLVIELVAEEREFDHIPKTLLRNVHPLMMLQGKIKKLFQDIHNSGGNKKITDFFLANVEFKNESFTKKSLKLISEVYPILLTKIIHWNRGTGQGILPCL